MFEHRHEPVLPRAEFIGRVVRSIGAAGLVVLVSFGIAELGYRWSAGRAWIDSLLNASMILTGMGPEDPMRTTQAKMFASADGIFSGCVFLTSFAIVSAPIVHRMLHSFHLPHHEDRN